MDKIECTGVLITNEKQLPGHYHHLNVSLHVNRYSLSLVLLLLLLLLLFLLFGWMFDLFYSNCLSLPKLHLYIHMFRDVSSSWKLCLLYVALILLYPNLYAPLSKLMNQFSLNIHRSIVCIYRHHQLTFTMLTIYWNQTKTKKKKINGEEKYIYR